MDMKVMRLAFSALTFAALLMIGQGCGDDEDPEVQPNNPRDTEQPDPEQPIAGPPEIEGFDLSLSTGDFWEFYWISASTFVAQGSSSGSTSNGNFRITLGSQTTIDARPAFQLEITGENLEEYQGPR